METKKTRKPRAKKVKETTVIANELPVEKNQLTLDFVIDNDKMYDELVTITFENGMWTKIYKKFRPAKIEEMLEDFSKFMVELESTGKLLKERDILNFLNLHILQFFSTVVGKYPTDIYEKLDVFKKMLDNELIEKVFESFEKEEVSKAYEYMRKKMNTYLEMMEQDSKLKSILKEKVKNMNLENRELVETVIFGEISNEIGVYDENNEPKTT